jgi:integrase
MKKDDKDSRAMRSKTDQRYWSDHLKKRVRKVEGTEVIDPNFSVQLAFGERKERIKLATANKSEAAARAASFYRSLIAEGWDGAYAAHEFSRVGRRGQSKATAVETDLSNQTLGALFSAYDKIATPRASTLSTYKKALRKIYSDVAGISGSGRAKAATGTRVWKEQVDSLPLSTVTSDALMEWKQKQLGQKDRTLDEKRAHAITLNSLIRNARSIFAKKHRMLLAKQIDLPDPIPFDDLRLETSPTPRYRSKIDARQILKSADEELRDSQPVLYAILNLALRSGLRRREIDTLMWKSVDLERKVIHVEANEYYDLKSTDSAGEVDIGDEFVNFLKTLRKQHPSEQFVISVLPKRRRRKSLSTDPEWSDKSSGYRCMRLFEEVTKWLRSHGVESKRPIHELRKEVGSLIADEHGIYAASRFMRHADIRITAASYLDKKKRIVAPI